MSEPFNIENFRQQMRGQAPSPSQPAPVQMQQAPAPMPAPAQMQQAPAPMPVPAQQQFQPPQSSMPEMVPQHAPQPMQPPMPQNPAMVPQSQPYPQSQPQSYGQAVGGAPQAWAPQGQPQAQPMQMQHMMPPPAAFMPPIAQSQAQPVETPSKKSRFNLKRLKKEKAPKIKKVKAQDMPEGNVRKTPPAKIFIFGFACGILSFFILSTIMSSVFAGNSSQSVQDLQAQNSGIQQPALPTAEVEAVMEPGAKMEN